MTADAQGGAPGADPAALPAPPEPWPIPQEVVVRLAATITLLEARLALAVLEDLVAEASATGDGPA